MAKIRFEQIMSVGTFIYGLTKSGRVFKYDGNGKWAPLSMEAEGELYDDEHGPDRRAPGDHGYTGGGPRR